MKIRIITISLCLIANTALALNVAQMKDICGSEQPAKQQFCHTYIGGAFDAIAVMNDRAKAQGTPVYCVNESEIFHLETIKQMTMSLGKKWHDKNAVLPIVEYFAEVGKCDIGKR